jgi:hypothetical protein
MSWEEAIRYARLRAWQTGHKWYVRGYQRTITYIGDWMYAAHADQFQEINRLNRAHQWWIDDQKDITR